MKRNDHSSADETDYTDQVRHRIRVVNRFRAESVLASLAEVRMQAAARTVEWALEHKIHDAIWRGAATRRLFARPASR